MPLYQTWLTKNKARAKYPQKVVLYAPISQKKIHNVVPNLSHDVLCAKNYIMRQMRKMLQNETI